MTVRATPGYTGWYLQSEHGGRDWLLRVDLEGGGSAERIGVSREEAVAITGGASPLEVLARRPRLMVRLLGAAELLA